ncbi:MAG TPA: hypothetical protein GX013_06120 [Propionibacterium sp.]|nr:hypothetical protein [Propionibacterium sp.]
MAPRLPAQLERFLDRILVVLGVIALFWLWHAAFLEWGVQRYVATWMDDRILWFLGVAALLAIAGLTRAALATAFSYPIVIIVGELLGSAAWDLQELFLGEEHEPVHAGWWIAVFLFAWVVILSAWGDWRARRWTRIESEERADEVVTEP